MKRTHATYMLALLLGVLALMAVAGCGGAGGGGGEQAEHVPQAVVKANLEERATRLAAQNSDGTTVVTVKHIQWLPQGEDEGVARVDIVSRDLVYRSIAVERTFVYDVTYDPQTGKLLTLKM